jgi:hypothetical protein
MKKYTEEYTKNGPYGTQYNSEKRRTRWIGHTLRHNVLVKDIIEGEIEGKVLRGRPRENKEEGTSQEMPGSKPTSIR